MPTYEYRCIENSHEFEIIQAFSDPPGASCPQCGSISERLISAAAIHFKGSGWYRKDNASSGSRSSNGTKPSDDSSSSDSSSKESKSASSSGGDKPSGSKTHTHGGSTHSH